MRALSELFRLGQELSPLHQGNALQQREAVVAEQAADPRRHSIDRIRKDRRMAVCEASEHLFGAREITRRLL